jgi:hypothetical protein
MGVERPNLTRVVNKVKGFQSPDVAHAYHILYTCSEQIKLANSFV